jgi:hypothetical protein
MVAPLGMVGALVLRFELLVAAEDTEMLGRAIRLTVTTFEYATIPALVTFLRK